MTSSHNMFRARLLTTTTLVAAVLLAAPGGARAAAITVNSATTSSQTLAAGDSLTVTPDGSITDVEHAVVVDTVTAASITNQGLLAVAHDAGSNIIGIVLNNGGLTGALQNQGTIRAETADIDIATGITMSNFAIAGQLTNSGAISAAAGSGAFANVAVGGIDIENGSSSASLNNLAGGRISVAGTAGATGATAATDDAFGIYLSDSTTGGLYNQAAISADLGVNTETGDITTKSFGIYLENGSSVDHLTNDTDATVSAASTLISTGGHVDGKSAALYFINGSVTNDVTNLGALSASLHAESGLQVDTFADGMYISGVTVGGDVNNAGSISADVSGQSNQLEIAARGIYLFSDTVDNVINQAGASIVSSAEAQATGGSGGGGIGYGVYISGFSNTMNGSFINEGAISGAGTASGADADIVGAGAGIYMSQTDVGGDIRNDGTGRIDASGAATQNGSHDAEAFVEGMDLDDLDVAGVVVNSGAVSATATSRSNGGTAEADAFGIFMDESTFQADFSNSNGSGAGTIDVSATATAPDGAAEALAEGIYISGTTVSGAVTNSGIIRVTASAVGATADAEAFGLYVLNTHVDGTIVNSGLIDAQAIAGGTAHAYGIYMNDSQADGGITNSGTIFSSTGDAIRLEGLTGATPITLNGGRIVGDVSDDTPGNGFSDVTVTDDFTTEGNFDVSSLTLAGGSDLTISAHNTVTLDHMGAGAGTFTFGVASPAAHGIIDVTAGALNFTGATIAAKVEGIGIASGDEFLIADGTAPIVGGPGGTKTAIADNSFLYNFQIANGTAASTPTDNTQLYLFVTQTASLQDAAATPNNLSVAEALAGGVSGSTSPQIEAIEAGLGAAPNRAAFNRILESAEPTVDNGNEEAAVGLTGEMFDLADGQLAEVNTGGGTGMAAGNSLSGIHGWAQGFGATSSQDERGGVSGYDAHIYGGAIGFDTRNLRADTVLGLSFGYGRANIDSVNANDTDTDVDSYQFMGYGNHDLGGHNFLTGMAVYGWNSNDQARHNVGAIPGLTAHADYDSWIGGARAGMGHNFALADTHTKVDSLLLTPQLFTEYLHFKRDAYTETGAGGADLAAGGANDDIWNLGASLQAEWAFKTRDGGRLKPNLHASYKYDVLGDSADTTASFAAGGSTFAVNGLNPGRSTFAAGAGVKFYNTSGWDFTANYDYTFRADFGASSGLLRAAYQF